MARNTAYPTTANASPRLCRTRKARAPSLPRERRGADLDTSHFLRRAASRCRRRSNYAARHPRQRSICVAAPPVLLGRRGATIQCPGDACACRDAPDKTTPRNLGSAYCRTSTEPNSAWSIACTNRPRSRVLLERGGRRGTDTRTNPHGRPNKLSARRETSSRGRSFDARTPRTYPRGLQLLLVQLVVPAPVRFPDHRETLHRRSVLATSAQP